MDDPADVRLVHPKPEGHSCHNDRLARLRIVVAAAVAGVDPLALDALQDLLVPARRGRRQVEEERWENQEWVGERGGEAKPRCSGGGW